MGITMIKGACGYPIDFTCCWLRKLTIPNKSLKDYDNNTINKGKTT